MTVAVELFTCTNEEHMIRLFCCQDSMDGDLRVANITLQQERLAADHTVHQEVVFDKVQHLVRHVQRGGDALFPGGICDTLQNQNTEVFIRSHWIMTPSTAVQHGNVSLA